MRPSFHSGGKALCSIVGYFLRKINGAMICARMVCKGEVMEAKPKTKAELAKGALAKIREENKKAEAQAKARLKDAEAQERKAEAEAKRKREDKQKYLLGAWSLANESLEVIKARMDKFLVRDGDRAFFDLAPLPPK